MKALKKSPMNEIEKSRENFTFNPLHLEDPLPTQNAEDRR